MKHIQKLRKLLLTLAVLMLAVQASFAASASYVDGSGTSQTVDATELEAATTNWTDGSWYIVPEGGLAISDRIEVVGTVNLILRDGATLTASAGITTTNATLNIYAQSAGTGALTATGNNGISMRGGGAGIGGKGAVQNAAGEAGGGTVNIYGGTVTAIGGNGGEYAGGGAGIGGGGLGWYSDAGRGAGGTVNIYGGTVMATGGNKGTSAMGGTSDGQGIGGGGNGYGTSTPANGTLTLGKGVKLYNGTDNTGTVLDDSDSESRSYSGSIVKTMFAEVSVISGPDKTALNTAITAAETLYDSIKDVENYSTIASTLKAAIDAAKGVANSDTANQDAVDAATTAITTAKTNAENEYKEAQKTAAEQPVTVAAKADPYNTGAYYATFYDSTTSYVADCEVYYATANADGRLTLQKAEGNVIKAGEGVILKATGENVTLTKTTTEANYDSLLTGSDSETTVENALVLSLGKNGVWFYKYSGTLGANKAYLAQ